MEIKEKFNENVGLKKYSSEVVGWKFENIKILELIYSQ